MSYVDGFVLVVPKKNSNKYKKMASDAAKFWKKHGALGYYECKGDDLNPDVGKEKILTYPKMVKLKKNEDVWFSFILYRSKKHRDSVNKKVMKEFEKKYKDDPSCAEIMPFDLKKMAYGGFKTLVKEKN